MPKSLLLVVLAAVIAYIPAINNGFIADDFVILQRIEFLKADPAFLFQVPPENFRLTSYIVFALLKSVFQFDYRAFYATNILFHAINCLMLAWLVYEVTRNKSVAVTSSALFAVFQAPQEAVMWLAAMNETLVHRGPDSDGMVEVGPAGTVTRPSSVLPHHPSRKVAVTVSSEGSLTGRLRSGAANPRTRTR